MKYAPSQEGWLSNLFGFGKKKTETAKEDDYGTLYLQPDEASDILGAVKSTTDEQWQQFLETTVIAIIDKETYTKCVVNGLMKLSHMLTTKMIPAWKRMEQFHWHRQEDNPVDYTTGTIKVPGLKTAMEQAGRVADAILKSQEYKNTELYTDAQTQADRFNKSLKDLGYMKKDIIDFIKYACLFTDESKDGDTRFYCTAEDHTDGWNYVVNHIFDQFYHYNSDRWPDLAKGDTVFQTTNLAFNEFDIDTFRLVKKFIKFSNLDIKV